MNNEDSKVDHSSPNSSSSSPLKHHHHQQQQQQDSRQTDFTSLESHKKKMRTKAIRIGGASSTTSSSCEPSKPPKTVRKPEPNAPKITPPCTECGRRFWSLKALFGHMRCHPERQWRGINPPPNLPRPSSSSSSENAAAAVVVRVTSMFTEEDHEVAESLLLLASGTGDATNITNNTSADHHHHLVASEFGSSSINFGGVFECSSCKKVFGSHQALGGHRASHKNVKGCFAIARTDQCEESNLGAPSDYHHQQQHYHHNFSGDPNKFIMKESSTSLDLGNINNHHQCSICFRVFSSGQALGGHKRCHWEKGEESSSSQLAFAAASGNRSWDLNLPAPVEMSSGGDHKEQGSSSSSSDLDLGLSLGI
ncbi:hypothetical protein Sjap_017481 [Stephania japonica]|uniref:C2H2-type domain-containing protein n=1 Tax=Stephania japonica TaxID=461633 RepID=A0AAP0NM13_9MAGN